MSIWNTLIAKLREIISMISGKDIAKELNISYAISPQMETAIHLWSDMYMDKASWLHEPTDDDPRKVASLGLATMIASEKARLALLEFESEISTPTEEVEEPNIILAKITEDENGEVDIQVPTDEEFEKAKSVYETLDA